MSRYILGAAQLTGANPHTSLSGVLDFDHVVTLAPEPEPTTKAAVYRLDVRPDGPPSAPEVIDPEPGSTDAGDGWALITGGLTGQHGYSGPWLHDSEQIAGGVARAVLEHAERTGGGYYVAVYATYSCDECGGAGVVFDGTDDPCPKIAMGECEPGGKVEGWAIAYRALGWRA